MLTAVKNATRSTLRRIGLDVIRYNPQKSHEAALARLLAAREIDTVLDIGGNEGQYATMVRRAGFRGKIISFEPLAEAHSKLRQAAARDPLWTVAPRMALGDHEGTLLMHVAANSASSIGRAELDALLAATCINKVPSWSPNAIRGATVHSGSRAAACLSLECASASGSKEMIFPRKPARRTIVAYCPSFPPLSKTVSISRAASSRASAAPWDFCGL